jgi:hypothetical protein
MLFLILLLIVLIVVIYTTENKVIITNLKAKFAQVSSGEYSIQIQYVNPNSGGSDDNTLINSFVVIKRCGTQNECIKNGEMAKQPPSGDSNGNVIVNQLQNIERGLGKPVQIIIEPNNLDQSQIIPEDVYWVGVATQNNLKLLSPFTWTLVIPPAMIPPGPVSSLSAMSNYN